MSNTTTFDALMAIYSERGVLTPQAVVEASRPDDAPLHDRFEWDDSVAGEKYREQQAAHLIRTVKVHRPTDTDRGTVTVRQFLPIGTSDIGADDSEPLPYQYVAIDDIPARAMEAIKEQMQRDVANLRRKYRDHAAVFDEVLAHSLEVA